jgi:hypothetical protein
VPVLNFVQVYARYGFFLLTEAVVVLCLYVATRWD